MGDLSDEKATMRDLASSLGSLAYIDLGDRRVNILNAKRKLLMAATSGKLNYYVYSPVHTV